MLRSIASLFLFSALASTASADEHAISNEKIIQASTSITWHRLLNYVEKTKRSDIIDVNNFVSPKGSVDPYQELLASIELIKSEPQNIIEEKRFSCRFPARARFIKEKLGINTKLNCPTYELWKSRAEPNFISFVYASQFVGNPSSAFGHSFIRFDHGYRSGLLGFSLTYSAKFNPEDSYLTYAFKGLTGGYAGTYEFDHYYPKAHSYANTENRDLWEYELDLNAEERLRIFEHAWELTLSGQTSYYFLDRNCTYQLLRLIDVANENFNFASQADGLFSTPQESVKLLAKANLIKRTEFRPSMRQKTMAYYEQMDSHQKSDLAKALRGKLTPEEINDPLTASTLVATLAMNELTNENLSSLEKQSLFSRATSARARLPAYESPVAQLKSESQNWNPIDSHNSMQLSVALIDQTHSNFVQLGFRPALHSFDEFAAGFLPNSQLIFMDTNIRIDDENKVRIHKISVIDIKSLQPLSIINNGLSWRAKMAYESTEENKDCLTCERLRSSLAFGYATDIRKQWLGYVLAGPTLDFLQPDSKIETRAGVSINFGAVITSFKSFVIKLDNQFDYLKSQVFDEETFLTADFSTAWQASKSSTVSLFARDVWNVKSEAKANNEIGLRFAESF